MVNRQDRARQFMPFAALRGYYDKIREQQRIKEPKRELSETEAERLSYKLNQLKKEVFRLKWIWKTKIFLK